MKSQSGCSRSTESFARLMILVLTLLLSWLAVSCGPKNAGQSEAKAEDSKPRIALIMKSLANEFFQTMREGAEKHHAGHSDEYSLIVNGIKNEQDVARQVQLVEQMIAQSVDGIVIAPADSKALIGVCKRAQEAGIVVVNIDNRFSADTLHEKGVIIPFIGPDNAKGAQIAGNYLADRLDPRSEVAILEGVPGAINGIQRREGFEQAMNSAGMRIVASQSASWETDKANRIASALITEHPNLKAILACNDSMALGAVAAIKSAGKSGAIKVVGFDNISAVKELVREGDILCTVDQHGDELAVFGIEYALEIIKGGKRPDDRETPVDLITLETL